MPIDHAPAVSTEKGPLTIADVNKRLESMPKPSVVSTEKVASPTPAKIELSVPSIPVKTSPAAEALGAVLGEDLSSITRALLRNEMILGASGVGGATKGAAANIANSADTAKASKFTGGVQKMLAAAGYLEEGKFKAGEADQATVDAIKKFQSDNHLKVDGVVGRDTTKALVGAVVQKLNPELTADDALAAVGISVPAPERRAVAPSAAPAASSGNRESVAPSAASRYRAEAAAMNLEDAHLKRFLDPENVKPSAEEKQAGALAKTAISSRLGLEDGAEITFVSGYHEKTRKPAFIFGEQKDGSLHAVIQIKHANGTVEKRQIERKAPGEYSISGENSGSW